MLNARGARRKQQRALLLPRWIAIETAGHGNNITLMKKLILLLLFLAVGVALGMYLEKQPRTQKIETTFKSDSQQVGNAVQTGVQKAVAVATNVAAQVKTGVTNAVDQIKQKLN